MRPRIDLVTPVRRDLVLLAHGGQETSTADPGVWRPPILRMWSLGLAAHRAVPEAAIGLARYRHRGWNAAGDTAADLRTLLDRLPDTVERVLLVGHSMGGRAVLRLAGHDRVTGVLGLAPWLPPADPVIEAPGRTVVLAHGTADRITDPRATTRYAGKLRASGLAVACFSVTGDKHAMLHRPADWSALTGWTVRQTLADGNDLDAYLSDDPSRDPDELPRRRGRQGMATAVAGIAWARLRLRIRDRL